jgi:hypothetical protein
VWGVTCEAGRGWLLFTFGGQSEADPSLNDIVIRGGIRGGNGITREIPAQYPHASPYTRQSFSFGMPLTAYPPGVYEVELTIEDRIAGTSVTTTTDFAVLGGIPNLGR